MDEQPKEPNARDYLICLVQQIDVLTSKVDRAVEYRKQQDRHSRLFNGCVMVLEWSMRLGSQVSAIFIASYVAVEHTWYFARIGGWLHKLLSWF